jgi:hypothetical protein
VILRISTCSHSGNASRTASHQLDGSGRSSPDGAPAAAVFCSSTRQGPLLDVPGHRYRRPYRGILQGAAPSPIPGQSFFLLHSYAPSSPVAACGAHAHLCFDSGIRAGHEEVLPSRDEGLRGDGLATMSRPISCSTSSPAKGITFPLL